MSENPIVEKLNERRVKLADQMYDMADKIAKENRNMDSDETEKWNQLNGEYDALQSRIEGVLAGEKRAREAEAAYLNVSSGVKKADTTELSEQLRSFVKPRGAVNEIYIPHLGIQELRDLTTSSSGVIPTSFRSRLWEYMIEVSGVLSTGVDFLETNSGETIKLPRATAHSTASAQTEATAISESDPTLGSVNSTVTKEGYLMEISRELVKDSGVDLEGYLARSAGRALGNSIGAAAVTAALAAASAGVTGPTGTSTTFGTQSTAGQGFDLLIDLFYSVIDPYRRRPSCAFLMSDVTAAKVRRLKSTDGLYAWQPSVVAGQPDSILSKPVFIDTNVPDPAANAESILFGDWSSMVVRIADGVRFERDDSVGFNKDVVTYRALVRHGSVSVDANALKSFTHSAT